MKMAVDINPAHTRYKMRERGMGNRLTILRTITHANRTTDRTVSFLITSQNRLLLNHVERNKPNASRITLKLSSSTTLTFSGIILTSLGTIFDV